MKRDYSLYLKDILDSIDKIESFTKDMSFEGFVEDEKTSSAVIKKLEVMGEASKQIPDIIKTNYANIPWKDMAAMRDKTTHFYFGVDYEIIWKVVVKELPKIKPEISSILREIEE